MKPCLDLSKFSPKRLESLRSELGADFELDVGQAAFVGEEAPARGLEQPVDFDPSGGLFHARGGVSVAENWKNHFTSWRRRCQRLRVRDARAVFTGRLM